MRARILPLAAAAVLLTALAGCYAGPYDDDYYGGSGYYGGYGNPYYGYDSPDYGYGGYYRVPSRTYVHPRWRHDDRHRHRHHKRWRDRDDDRHHHRRRARDRDDDRDDHRRRVRDRDRRDDDDRRRFRERERRVERDDRLRAEPRRGPGYERRGAIARSGERRAWEERTGLEAERAEIWRRDLRSSEK